MEEYSCKGCKSRNQDQVDKDWSFSVLWYNGDIINKLKKIWKNHQ